MKYLSLLIILFSLESFAKYSFDNKLQKVLVKYNSVKNLDQFVKEFHPHASKKDLKSIKKIFSKYDFSKKPQVTVVKNKVIVSRLDIKATLEFVNRDTIYLNGYRLSSFKSNPMFKTYMGKLNYFYRVARREKVGFLNTLIGKAYAGEGENEFGIDMSWIQQKVKTAGKKLSQYQDQASGSIDEVAVKAGKIIDKVELSTREERATMKELAVTLFTIKESALSDDVGEEIERELLALNKKSYKYLRVDLSCKASGRSQAIRNKRIINRRKKSLEKSSSGSLGRYNIDSMSSMNLTIKAVDANRDQFSATFIKATGTENLNHDRAASAVGKFPGLGGIYDTDYVYYGESGDLNKFGIKTNPMKYSGSYDLDKNGSQKKQYNKNSAKFHELLSQCCEKDVDLSLGENECYEYLKSKDLIHDESIKKGFTVGRDNPSSTYGSPADSAK